MTIKNCMLSRRGLLAGVSAVAAGSLLPLPSLARTRPQPAKPRGPVIDSIYYDMYGAIEGEPFPIPAVDPHRIHAGFLRREVAYPTAEKPGTIIVDPNARYLYFVEEGGKAIRYGVGVGRQGFAWSGVADVRFKQEWPKWFPPPEMIERQPELRPYANGMPGGPGNPIGCRALYLFQNNKDTLYRIHGTTEPSSIGTRASSGCIRMINQDAIDLYGRVPLGTKVIVLGSPGSAGAKAV